MRRLQGRVRTSVLYVVPLFLFLFFFFQLPTEMIAEGDPQDTWLSHLCQRQRPHLKRVREKEHLKVTWKPVGEGSIFFTQTSCATDFSSREACAVESAALHHPDKQVILYMTSPYISSNNPINQVLLGLRNVQMHWLDLDQVFVEEPLLTWHQERFWYINQDIAPATVSDAVRTELLRRMGGVFLDLDAITLRPLPARANWLGRLDHNQVSTAAANFTRNHRLFQMVVDAIPKAHDPRHCCTIGPKLVTSYLHQLCPDNVTLPDATDAETMESCGDITIFNTHAFYPLSYSKEDLLSIFKSREGIGPRFFGSTRAYTLHLFHSLTKSGRVISNSDSILEEAARRNCPQVYKTILENNLLL